MLGRAAAAESPGAVARSERVRLPATCRRSSPTPVNSDSPEGARTQNSEPIASRPNDRAVGPADGRPAAGVRVLGIRIARRLLLVEVHAEAGAVAGPHAAVADLRRAGEDLARFVPEKVFLLDAGVVA